jgi:hypothetical protein
MFKPKYCHQKGKKARREEGRKDRKEGRNLDVFLYLWAKSLTVLTYREYYAKMKNNAYY